MTADNNFSLASDTMASASLNAEATPSTETTEMVVDYGGWSRRKSDCIQLASGQWYLRSVTVLCHDGERHPRTSCVNLLSGEWVLRDDDRVATLDSGDYCWLDDAVMVGDRLYHIDDTFSCDCCGNFFHNDDCCSASHANYCESCFSDNCGTCSVCEESFHADDLHESDDGDLRCSYCRRSSRLVSDYGDRSANKMRPESRDVTLFGIELEVEPRSGSTHDGASFVRQHLPKDYCVLKYDGSLGPGGFEIVTRPDSVEVHRRKWQPLFDHNPSGQLRSWNTGRCGMHVHVSRAGLTQLQLGKMLCFLNAPDNASFVVKIAGRRCDRWSRIEPKKIKDVFQPPERYVALNLCNSRTVEFRIFRGTLNRSTFYKNIEFCAALVEFCSPATHSIAESTSARCFMQWVDHHKYPNLYDWLVRRGFIADRRKRRSA